MNRFFKNPESGEWELMDVAEGRDLGWEEDDIPFAAFAKSNCSDGVRRFIRDLGYKPTVENVDVIGREISRTASENERVIARNKEIEAATGRPALIDSQGRDALKVAKEEVERSPINPYRRPGRTQE